MKTLCLAAVLSSAAAYVVPITPSRPAVRRTPAPQALVPAALLPTLIQLAEIVDQEGERIYGAVDAPSWVAPVGGIALISTALLPMCAALAPCQAPWHRARPCPLSPRRTPVLTAHVVLSCAQPAVAGRGGVQGAAGH